jgi:hypothetical protein
MSSHRDYYRILHVQPDAPTAIVHASYRTLMQRLRNHPDLGGDHEHAVLLNEAHAVLSDPDRRAAYDLERDIEAARNTAQPEADESPTCVDETAEVFAALRCMFCGAPHGLQRAIDVEDECSRCFSPLLPAERHRLEYSGQRMLARIPKQRAVTFYVVWPQAEGFSGEMRDVSLNGMQLQTMHRLKSNLIIKIDCSICQALARVAHCHGDPQSGDHWLIGVEFLTLRFPRKRGTFISARA